APAGVAAELDLRDRASHRQRSPACGSKVARRVRAARGRVKRRDWAAQSAGPHRAKLAARIAHERARQSERGQARSLHSGGARRNDRSRDRGRAGAPGQHGLLAPAARAPRVRSTPGSARGRIPKNGARVKELSPLGRELVKAGRNAHAPSAADKQRIHEALQHKLAAPPPQEPPLDSAALPKPTPTPAAPWPLISAVTVGAGLLAGALYWGLATNASAPAEPTRVPEPSVR